MSDKEAKELDDSDELETGVDASGDDEVDGNDQIDPTDEDIEIEDDDDDLDALVEEQDGELQVVEEELSQKDLNARSLAIRRALELRMEQKRLEEDLDYLDLDLED